MTSQDIGESKPFIGPINDTRLGSSGPNSSEPFGLVDLTSSQQLGRPENHWTMSRTPVLDRWDSLVLQALKPLQKRWQARSEADGLTIPQRVYAFQRARSCKTSPSARALNCGQGTAFDIKCGCKRSTAKSRCNVRHTCEDCAKRVRAGYSSRIEAGLRRGLADLRKRMFKRSRAGECFRGSVLIRMVTLTARHSGDPVADRKRINKAWQRWHRWLRRELGYAPAYAGAWELTAGEDGLGHPHIHVCFVTTNFDYKRAREAWQVAIGDPDAQWDVKSSANPVKACWYVAKYVCKVAADVPDEMHAHWIGGTYAKRTVTASRGLLARIPCPCCRQWWRVDYGSGEFMQKPVDLDAAARRRREDLDVPWMQGGMGFVANSSQVYAQLNLSTQN